MIGSNDLLADWGLAGQYEHSRLRDAYAKTMAACRKHGKHVGVGGLASRPQLAAEFVRLGARYVSTGTDLGFLLAACTAKALPRSTTNQRGSFFDEEFDSSP